MDQNYFEQFKDHIDELTGVYKRDVIVNYIEKLISQNKQFSTCILDVDNFKYINDGYGHLFGDEVLKVLAQSIKAELDGVGVVGRYGGDEFIIVVENVVDYNVIWEIWHTLLNVGQTFDKPELKKINLTVTMGSSRFPKDSTSIDGLIEVADKALYRGKMKGRNCFIIYLPEKHANIDLKTDRDKIVSSQYLLARAMNGLTAGENFKQEVKETLNYFGNYLMIDHLCLQNDEMLVCEYFHSLCKKKDFKVIPSKIVNTYVNGTTGIFVKNIFLFGANASNIDRLSINEGIYSSAYIKLQAHGKTFGFLRADVTENVRGRIWQAGDIDLLESIAHIISLELYYQNKEIKDLE